MGEQEPATNSGFANALFVYTPSLSLPLLKGEGALGREGAWTPPQGR